MNQLTPREIVRELDRFIIGQDEAKRAVAVALRNRYRRAQLPDDIREEVTPKKTTTVSTVYKGVNYSPVYNYTYYRKKYADLREKYGTDKKAYFDHFCKYGMKEGRKACATFDVNKYRKRYADLQKAFGDDLPAYYKHFVVYGKKEGRNGK